MKFETYIPCDVLKPYIKTLAIQETEEERTYKVLPDTGLVIGFQYKGKLSYQENDQDISLSASGITGLRDEYRIFKNSRDIGTVLVVFKETGAAHFFNQPLHELFKESISLDNFILRSKLLLVEEQLLEAKSDKQRITVVENFLVSLLTPFEQDKLVISAISIIQASKGTIRITDLANQLHISQSPLEKRFRKIVGASPKKFASIIKLKAALESPAEKNSVAGLSYEMGFYDQAHFIKEFKKFTGLTPSNYFSPQK